jgi:hypothetical protein
VSNSIPYGVGGGVYQYGTVLVESTILAGNVASNGYGPEFFRAAGTLTERCNLVANNTNCSAQFAAGATNANGSYVGTAAAPLDPKLQPLAGNGGPTLTCALQGDSDAVNHGANPAGLLHDQRGEGYNRVMQGQPDIGAFEYGAGPGFRGTVILIR